MTLQRTSLATVALASLVAAQGVILDGNARYQINAIPTTPTAASGGSANFQCNTTSGDVLFEAWWWYRVGGDTREFAFNSSGSQLVQAYAGRDAVLEWGNVDTRGFSARLEINCRSTGARSGVATHRMRLTNTTAAPVTIALFGYIDIDMCGSGSNSVVANPGPNRQLLTGPTCTDTMEIFAQSPDLYQVGAFAGVRTLLTNTAVNNLNNSGLPFGPGDYTGAFEWYEVYLLPQQSYTAVMAMAINSSVPEGAAQARVYGMGKAGTNGIAVFEPRLPYIGSANPILIGNGLPGAVPFMFFALGEADIPVLPLATIYLDPATIVPVPIFMPAFDSFGESQILVPVENNLSLLGGQVFFQALFLDPASYAGLAHTGGLGWTLGGY